MPRFDLSQPAEADIAGIAEYTVAQWGPAQAHVYLDALETRLIELARHPLVGRKRDDLIPGFLSVPFGSHVIFYERASFGIVVMRVLHRRQDPQHQFEQGS